MNRVGDTREEEAEEEEEDGRNLDSQACEEWRWSLCLCVCVCWDWTRKGQPRDQWRADIRIDIGKVSRRQTPL